MSNFFLTTVYSVNHRGSDEYSVHVIAKGREPAVVAIFRKGTKAENRQNAMLRAREIAAERGARYLMRHNLSGRQFDELLPANAR